MIKDSGSTMALLRMCLVRHSGNRPAVLARPHKRVITARCGIQRELNFLDLGVRPFRSPTVLPQEKARRNAPRASRWIQVKARGGQHPPRLRPRLVAVHSVIIAQPIIGNRFCLIGNRNLVSRAMASLNCSMPFAAVRYGGGDWFRSCIP